MLSVMQSIYPRISSKLFGIKCNIDVGEPTERNHSGPKRKVNEIALGDAPSAPEGNFRGVHP